MGGKGARFVIGESGFREVIRLVDFKDTPALYAWEIQLGKLLNGSKAENAMGVIELKDSMEKVAMESRPRGRGGYCTV